MKYYSDEAIDLLKKVYRDHSEQQSELWEFLEPVAKALGLSLASVDCRRDTVHFTAEWYGSYQSHDVECFSFSIEWLQVSTDFVAQKLLEQRKEDADKLERDRKESYLAEKRAKLKELQEFFEKEGS